MKFLVQGGKPSGSNEIFGLDLASTHLPIFGAFLDVLNELLLLIFELDSFTVKFALGFLERSLVLSKAFLRGHAFAKSPLHDL